MIKGIWENPKLRDKLIVTGIVVVIILLYIFIYVFINDGGKCVRDPIEFYESIKNVDCVCYEPGTAPISFGR